MSNKSCSVPLEKFFAQLLLTVRGFQNVVRRLLSLAGFSTLVECDTFTEVLYTVFINGGRAERPGFECMKTRLGRPWLQITDHNKNGVL